jgi:hypothetical protein
MHYLAKTGRPSRQSAFCLLVSHSHAPG